MNIYAEFHTISITHPQADLAIIVTHDVSINLTLLFIDNIEQIFSPRPCRKVRFRCTSILTCGRKVHGYKAATLCVVLHYRHVREK